MKFTDLDIEKTVMTGIEDAGFTEATPVQAEAFQHTLAGRDVAVQSQTGTGKTATFLITLFHHMKQNDRYGKALIIAPTRELAVQIEQEALMLGKHTGLRVGSIYGGVGYEKQIKLLEEGVEVIVGTPGRLIDLNQSRKFDFRDIGILVIDEADRLFDMGFYPDLKKMLQRMRPREERMTMLFSATLSVRVRNLAWEYMNDAVAIEIHPESITVDNVDQTVFHVASSEKFRLLIGLLKKETPESAIIFANTKRQVEDLSLRLNENGFSTQFIIGDLPQKKRLRTIESIKNGKTPILVATDVAARGLHVDELDLVINYDIPEDPENYVHRIGRTARAGKSGVALSLACERYVFGLESIEQLIDQKIPAQIPEEGDYGEDVTGGRRLSYRKERGRTERGRDHRGQDRSRTKSHSRSGEAPGSRDPKKPERKKRRRRGNSQSSPDKALNDRLAYYREKYGEDFVPSEQGAEKPKSRKRSAEPKPRAAATPRVEEPKKKKGGIFAAIRRLFGKND